LGLKDNENLYHSSVFSLGIIEAIALEIWGSFGV